MSSTQTQRVSEWIMKSLVPVVAETQTLSDGSGDHTIITVPALEVVVWSTPKRVVITIHGTGVEVQSPSLEDGLGEALDALKS